LASVFNDDLVQIIDLTISYSLPGSAPVRAVDHASLEIHRGEVIGVLGESGSGKRRLPRQSSALLPPNAHYDDGSIMFRGGNLLALTELELRTVRVKKFP